MEATLEAPVVIDQRTDYERERDKPIPSTLHALITKRIVFQLERSYGDTLEALPELNLSTPGKPTVPDIAVYPKSAIDYVHDVISRTDAPLLTVEILSPKQALNELVDKTVRYFAFGVRSCWIVLPELQAILIYDQPGRYRFFHDDETATDTNNALSIDLRSVFG
jgi:Uma2 family endonuclease